MVKSKACHFNELCCLGGHCMIYSWYVALADALQGGSTPNANNTSRIWKLYEAGMTANIRLRLTTSHTQVLTDAHVWSEAIRATHMSGCGDLLNFVRPTIAEKAGAGSAWNPVQVQARAWDCRL